MILFYLGIVIGYSHFCFLFILWLFFLQLKWLDGYFFGFLEDELIEEYVVGDSVSEVVDGSLVADWIRT